MLTGQDVARLVRLHNDCLDALMAGAGSEFKSGRAFGEKAGLERGIEACGYAFEKDADGYAVGIEELKEN